MGDIHGLPDEVLEVIFLLLTSPARLICAALTCRRWHDIVAGGQFLSRFASLNNGRHFVAGSYYNGLLQISSNRALPIFVATSSPPVDVRRFSISFLWRIVHDATFWSIVDSRGPLLLWANNRMDMVVCEPLAQRYQVIPPMAASAAAGGYRHHSGPFLLDAGDRASGGVDLSNFRVICVAYDPDGGGSYRASMFTSRDGSWHVYAMDGEKMGPFMGRTRDALYWHAGGRAVTAMDRSTDELSSSELPAANEAEGTVVLKVAVGRDGEPCVLAVAAGGVLRVFAVLPRWGSSTEWALEKTIQLSVVAAGLPGYLPSYFSGELPMVNVADAALVTVEVASLWRRGESWAFRLDVEIMEAKLVAVQRIWDNVAFPCDLPWPPLLHAHSRT